MSAEQSGGNTRRLTEAEERRGSEMYAAGATETEVADALGISRSTAHRLRERLHAAGVEVVDLMGGEPKDDAPIPGMTPMPAEIGTGVVLHHPELGAADAAAERAQRLADLHERRGELSERLADLEERAAASRRALSGLDAERVTLLADGNDAAPLRPRVQSARDDLADWETSAGMVRQQIAECEVRIAEVQAAEQLAELRVQLAEAVVERDVAVRATGGRMEAAVLAVRDAAVEFTAALNEEREARDRAEQLAAQVAGVAHELGQPGPDVPGEPQSTALFIPEHYLAGGPGLALARAVQLVSSQRLDAAKAVAAQLAEAFGWLPPTREEHAAEQLRMQQAWAERQRMAEQAKKVPLPWTRPDTGQVAIDENGREIYLTGYRPAVPHPMDAWHGLGNLHGR
jgi:hypothetical protein